ncbi:FMR1-interacting protein NUFIP2 [Corythoichthys intestinalis]|uniref:FMR1-interacting protein NUFIP2 n=1 Tax=Corythoichthys intestinalis TaxID=161448 RepID=UPI0025A66A67|nr:FMR1-interacting protein NUFIP2 [Corythoichthys intestinalis]XP_061801014.1 FMR1-interacting protein NUFIP2-like [Nerophis lumbriciformis]
MEAQPKDRARDSRNQHRGDDASPPRWTPGLKHEQNHFHQRQHQETNAKKTGHKKVSVGEEEVEKSRHLFTTVGMPHPPNSNGNRHASNTNVKKSTTRLYSAAPKAGGKGLDYKKTMDLKNDKAVDSNHQEDKKDAALLQNGVAHTDVILNGYSCKDYDGSGSEAGYTVSKKHKARCNVKNTDNAMGEQEAATFNMEAAEKGGTSRPDCLKATHKAETQSAPRRTEASVGEPSRKNSLGKKIEERHKAKVCSPSKEDSWTLFKPPPVFPVDNSSAKIVPKISYASKVKENLNKVAQGGAEVVPPPVRLSQVPMSAMKTITSASFTNGPVSASGNGTFFSPAATASGDNVASPLESKCNSSSTSSPPIKGEAYELRKYSLLIYPLNMQAALPSARHLNPPATQTNQKALGEIFQNKWGLSFINEPNLAPEGGSGPPPAQDGLPPGQRRAKPCFEGPFFLETGTLAQDGEKRTFIISPARVPAKEENGEKTSADAPRKESAAKLAQGHADTVSFGTSKEQVSLKDVCRRRSWGAFDVKAAVTYHTKEMEYVFSLQKQYPNLVLVYDEAEDGPDQ